jgi:inorganic pyrophosphatase
MQRRVNNALTGNGIGTAAELAGLAMTGGTVEIEMIVEVPQGSRNKYEADPESGRIRLDRMLFTSTRYPADYGFFPNTLAEDGDPLDAMVLLGEPAFPGCVVSVRPLGVFWMTDEHGPDAKVLTVPARDPRYANLYDLADVAGHLLDEIGHFFDIYKELEPDKGTDVRGWQDRAAAEEVITMATARAATANDQARAR